MNKDKSDVIFLIGGQPLPAQKALLSIKNRVFRAMFSDKFKESKDREVVIKNTTFDAFKTFIWFLYSDELLIKDSNDLNLIEEVVKLSDRYEANRLMRKTTKRLIKTVMTFNNFEQISRIAFRYQMKELMSKVMAFIDKNFNQFVAKDEEELKLLNESTDGRLLKVMANNYRKIQTRNSICQTCDKPEPICHSCKTNPNEIYCIRCGTYLPELLAIICKGVLIISILTLFNFYSQS